MSNTWVCILTINLSRKYHISHIASKKIISIGIISRSRHFVPLNNLFHIYKSLIQPYLLYGLFSWGQADKTHRNILLLLQNRGLRLMVFGEFNAHATLFFVSSKLHP